MRFVPAIWMAIVNLQPTLRQETIPIDQKWTGSGSSIEKSGAELVGTKARWLQFWERHAPKTQAPEIDFAKSLVVACFPAGKFTGVSGLSAESDGKSLTLTLVLSEKEAAPEAFKPQYAIVVLPRTTHPIRVRTRVAECGTINAKRDGDLAELKTVCERPGACHEKCVKEEAKCLDCGKAARPACDATCAACAKGRNLCPKCGLGLPTCSKPGKCHEACNMSAKPCPECNTAYINGCDALCAKCAGKTRCRLCGRPVEK